MKKLLRFLFFLLVLSSTNLLLKGGLSKETLESFGFKKWRDWNKKCLIPDNINLKKYFESSDDRIPSIKRNHFKAVLERFVTKSKEKIDDKSKWVGRSVPEYLKDQEKLTENVNRNGLNSFAQKVILPDNAVVLTIGDLHGNYTDLSSIISAKNKEGKNPYFRKLNELKLRSNVYIIFTGDLTDRGNSGVETMATALILQMQNPHHVFICRGNHEQKYEIFNYGFRKEVAIKYLLKELDENQIKTLLGVLKNDADKVKNLIKSKINFTKRLGWIDPDNAGKLDFIIDENFINYLNKIDVSKLLENIDLKESKTRYEKEDLLIILKNFSNIIEDESIYESLFNRLILTIIYDYSFENSDIGKFILESFEYFPEALYIGFKSDKKLLWGQISHAAIDIYKDEKDNIQVLFNPSKLLKSGQKRFEKIIHEKISGFRWNDISPDSSLGIGMRGPSVFNLGVSFIESVLKKQGISFFVKGHQHGEPQRLNGCNKEAYCVGSANLNPNGEVPVFITMGGSQYNNATKYYPSFVEITYNKEKNLAELKSKYIKDKIIYDTKLVVEVINQKRERKKKKHKEEKKKKHKKSRKHKKDKEDIEKKKGVEEDKEIEKKEDEKKKHKKSRKHKKEKENSEKIKKIDLEIENDKNQIEEIKKEIEIKEKRIKDIKENQNKLNEELDRLVKEIDEKKESLINIEKDIKKKEEDKKKYKKHKRHTKHKKSKHKEHKKEKKDIEVKKIEIEKEQNIKKDKEPGKHKKHRKQRKHKKKKKKKKVKTEKLEISSLPDKN